MCFALFRTIGCTIDHLLSGLAEARSQPDSNRYFRSGGTSVISRAPRWKVTQLAIPEQVAHDSGMMAPTDSDIIPPTVPR
jgi:hypothetical protein